MLNREAKFSRTALLAGVLGMSVAGFAGPVTAAESTDGQSAPSAEAPAALQKLKKKQKEIRQLATELRKIQQKATKANPELKAEQESYRDLVFKTMESQDFDPQAEIENMRGLQSDLQAGGDLGQQERQKKMQELQKKRQAFRSKQRQAMQSQDVQDARKVLDEKMRAAMKEQNPQVPEMIAQLNQLQQEYQKLLRKTMSQQQGGGQSPQS